LYFQSFPRKESGKLRRTCEKEKKGREIKLRRRKGGG